MPKEKDKLIRKLKKNKEVSNPYALANWIYEKKNRRRKKKHKKVLI